MRTGTFPLKILKSVLLFQRPVEDSAAQGLEVTGSVRITYIDEEGVLSGP